MIEMSGGWALILTVAGMAIDHAAFKVKQQARMLSNSWFVI
jgi:hypothetical protein